MRYYLYEKATLCYDYNYYVYNITVFHHISLFIFIVLASAWFKHSNFTSENLNY